VINSEFLHLGIQLLGMASPSINIGNESDPLSKFDKEIQEVISNRDIPKCQGVPRHL
jgi:hypothetical protein